MKNTILYNWTLGRRLWVIIGLVIITEGVFKKDLVSFIGGLIYTGIGVFNKTLCSTGLCSFSLKIIETPTDDNGTKQIEN